MALAPAWRVVFGVAGALVLLAGIQTYVFTDRTETHFAWTIGAPVTTAFLGAGYLGALSLEWIAASRPTWAHARVAAPAVLVFTSLTLTATLLHLDAFHFGAEHTFGTQIVTWAWLVVYAGVPPVLAGLLGWQLRRPSVDPPRMERLPAPLRILAFGVAAVFIAVGITLFIAPGTAPTLWPWELTPLTARAIGAWLVGLGVASGHVGIENDFDRAGPVWPAEVAFAVLQLGALVRYPEGVELRSVRGAMYLVALTALAMSGVYGWWRWLRGRSPQC